MNANQINGGFRVNSPFNLKTEEFTVYNKMSFVVLKRAMAVYFDHRIEAPEGRDAPTRLTWHTALPLLAVASTSSTGAANVDLYLQQVNTILSSH